MAIIIDRTERYTNMAAEGIFAPPSCPYQQMEKFESLMRGLMDRAPFDYMMKQLSLISLPHTITNPIAEESSALDKPTAMVEIITSYHQKTEQLQTKMESLGESRSAVKLLKETCHTPINDRSLANSALYAGNQRITQGIMKPAPAYYIPLQACWTSAADGSSRELGGDPSGAAASGKAYSLTVNNIQLGKQGIPKPEAFTSLRESKRHKALLEALPTRSVITHSTYLKGSFQMRTRNETFLQSKSWG